MNADEAHIEDLLQANNTLSNLSEVLGDNFLTAVLASWKQLYTLAIDSLRSKHGIEAKPALQDLGTVQQVSRHSPPLYLCHTPLSCTASSEGGI